VRTSEAQATITGRSWRLFSVFWPFKVAGLNARAHVAEPIPATVDGSPIAPTGGLPHVAAAMGSSGSGTSSDDESDAVSGSSCASGGDARGWGPVQDDNLAAADVGGDSLPDEHLHRSSDFISFFPETSVQDAYLELFCQAARLGGMLFGDNVADATTLTDGVIDDMEEVAEGLGVDSLQTLYGHVNTTKLHRLVAHLGDELRSRGNLWEGDTLVNEKLHGSCKRMYNRSNKRGPGVALQMMRCEETQSAVLRELCDAYVDDDASAGRSQSTTSGSGSDGSDCGINNGSLITSVLRPTVAKQ